MKLWSAPTREQLGEETWAELQRLRADMERAGFAVTVEDLARACSTDGSTRASARMEVTIGGQRYLASVRRDGAPGYLLARLGAS